MRALRRQARIRPMPRRALTLVLALLAFGALAFSTAVAAHAGAPWTTGTYAGTASSDNAAPKDRGTVRFAVTKTRATAQLLTLVMRCDSGETRRFTVRGAGSAKLRPGPAGAGFHLKGQREVGGYAVDWDVMGGIHGSRMRLTVDAGARGDGDDCLLFGRGQARPR